MINKRFRAIYMAALIVFCVGLLGTILVPKARANAFTTQAVVASIEPNLHHRFSSSSKPLIGFATLGLLSSAGLALLYSKSNS